MDYKMIFIKLKGKSWKFKEEKKRYRKKSLKVIKKMPKYIVSILYSIPNKKIWIETITKPRIMLFRKESSVFDGI